ncbi:MAG: sodium:glutamate symporter [Clostridium sp.]|nr:sodium:glutamate symporter [Clostridium sp.]MBO6150965.1 sodium:glutamate symporter [Clostridium sp.]
MEVATVKIGMFEMMAIVVLVIYLGQWIRSKVPLLKQYCIPSAVVGGTLFSILTCILYMAGIVQFEWENQSIMNNFFYNIFFAASGMEASLALLKKGGKLVVIFSVLAAILAVLQNALALGVGRAMGMNPLTALMAGSTPLTGGHGNAASFGPIAAEMGGTGAVEVAVAAATFGLISGCLIGGPIGRQLIRKNHLDENYVEQKEETLGEKAAHIFKSSECMNAWFILIAACGLGQLFLQIRQLILPNLNMPIHVMCMLAGILIRLVMDKTGRGSEEFYEVTGNVGDISLGLFVSLSIITMKLWQLIDLALPLLTILFLQLVMIYLFVRFITFNLCGRDYDAAVIAVGHTGFGLGAVPVSMATMSSVCEEYYYSKLAFFVVPLIGGFISNITNAIAITTFLNIAAGML